MWAVFKDLEHITASGMWFSKTRMVIYQRTWKSFRERVNASISDTLQTNMHRRCITHNLMKNAQNDETKESRKTCSGYKIQRQFKEDNLEIYES
jgi:hypothetical protein